MMIGTWDIKVTLRDCQSGSPIKTFRAMNTFGCGGTLIETGARDESRLCSPGQGTWRHIGGQDFCAILWSLHSNGNGAIAQRRKVTRHIELSDDGKEFTATASVEIFDIDERLIRTNCTTETGKRLE